jgi:hypothetical protein
MCENLQQSNCKICILDIGFTCIISPTCLLNIGDITSINCWIYILQPSHTAYRLHEVSWSFLCNSVVAFLFEKAGVDVYSFNQQMHIIVINSQYYFKSIKLEQQVDVLEVCSSMNPICCVTIVCHTYSIYREESHHFFHICNRSKYCLVTVLYNNSLYTPWCWTSKVWNMWEFNVFKTDIVN